MEKKLGLFTAEDMKVKAVKIQKEKAENVSASKAASAGAAMPFWVTGGAGLAASAAY